MPVAEAAAATNQAYKATILWAGLGSIELLRGYADDVQASILLLQVWNAVGTVYCRAKPFYLVD